MEKQKRKIILTFSEEILKFAFINLDDYVTDKLFARINIEKSAKLVIKIPRNSNPLLVYNGYTVCLEV